MKIKNVLLVHKLGYNNIEKKTVQAAQDFLKENKILYRTISPVEVHHGMVQDRDLIVIVGGDGTFLKTAQYVTDATPFLCINANDKKTEGFFSNTTIRNCKQKLRQICKGTSRKNKLYRLSAKINGKQIEPCLNEYYIGKRRPYDVSNYKIKTDRKEEHQKSSGVLVSTPAGSTAWSRGAGGKLLRIESKQFQFVVRELYVGKLTKRSIKKGILKSRNKIIITPQSDGMIVVADALGREHKVKKNEKIIITMKKEPLYLFY